MVAASGGTAYQLPDAEDVVIPALLDRNARAWPDDDFVQFDDGTTWTRREALDATYGAAASLAAAGVRQGEHVALFLGNGADYLKSWWGAAALGAVVVPINVAYRGAILAHLLSLARPVTIVGEPSLLQRLDELDDQANVPTVRLTPGDLAQVAPAPELDRPIALWDTAALILTSGTTGPSKLSATSHLHLYLGGSHFTVDHHCDRRDVYLIDLPLFHIGMMYQIAPCLSTGTRLAIRSAPSLSAYWEVARDTGATVAMVLSTMVPFLLGQPARAAERQHGLRLLLAAPLPRDVDAFLERFNIAEMHAAYGSTEASAPLVRHPRDELTSGYCGRVREGFQVRLVDEHDVEVPVGQMGEVVVRTDQPWMLTSGYVANPEATVAAWRNGWYHTGDAMRRDDEGRFYFVDRIKDAVRRRGENISSFEVEAEVVAFPGVSEVACVPYRGPSDVEDEVKVWIVAEDGVDIEPERVLRFCVDRMPYFMVPRYYEVVGELPKTPSARVRKHLLRDRGNGPSTWDREAHGFQVTRNGLRSIAALEDEPANS